MTAAKLNLTLYIGTTFGPVLINCRNADDDPVDLTGWTATAHVRKTPKTAFLFSLNATISDPENGQITLALTDEETEALDPVNGYWDLVLQKPTGERIGPYIQGRCDVVQIVTQRGA